MDTERNKELTLKVATGCPDTLPAHGDRWQDWLHAAKERAVMMEQLAPLAPHTNTRKQRPTEQEAGAVESWYEPNPIKYPIQDGNMLVKGKWFKRATVTGHLESEAA